MESMTFDDIERLYNLAKSGGDNLALFSKLIRQYEYESYEQGYADAIDHHKDIESFWG